MRNEKMRIRRAAFLTAALTMLATIAATSLPVVGVSAQVWTEDTPVPYTWYNAGYAVYNNKLYLLTGTVAGYAYTDSVNVYDPGADSWTSLTDGITSRSTTAATTYLDSIYVFGGFNGGYLSTNEVYFPGTDSWGTRASMPSARRDMVAVTIGDSIYVAGGYNGGYDASLDRYDPGSDSWVSKASLTYAVRDAAGAAVEGKLYLIGGYNGSYRNYVQVYDPVTNSWEIKTPMPTSRRDAEASVIDGRIYVVGGYNSSSGYLATVEVYDPVKDEWTRLSPLPESRRYGAVGSIYGKLHYAGGYQANPDDKVYTYDPVKEKWAGPAYLSSARYGVATAAVDGYVYFFGGYTGYYQSIVQRYEPETRTWTTMQSMPYTRRDQAAVAHDQKIYLLGGSDGNAFYVYDIQADSWEIKPDIPNHHYYPVAGVINDKIYLTGGLQQVDIYDIATETWSSGTQNPVFHQNYPTGGVIDGQLYVVGGYDGSYMTNLQVYDPAGDSWSTGTGMPTERYMAAAGVDDDNLFVFGGYNSSSGYLNVTEQYDPDSNSWTTLDPMIATRRQFSGSVLDGYIYLAGGYSSGYQDVVEVYKAGSLKASRLSLDPAASETAAPAGTDIIIEFNWPVDPATVYLTNIDVTDATGSVVPGSLTFHQSANIAIFTPSTAFAAGDSVNVLISGNVADKLGIGFDGNDDGTSSGGPADAYTWWFEVTADNPTVTVDSVTGTEHITGDVTINFTTSSPLNSFMQTAEWAFSTDGEVWDQIDDSAITGDSPRQPGSHTITWSTTTGSNNLVGAVEDTVYFRMKVEDSSYQSNLGVSLLFTVDNNLPPTVTITPVDGEQSGDIVFSYTLSDAENDTLNIVFQAAWGDHSTWYPITYSGQISDLSSDLYSNTLTWHSLSDLPAQTDDLDVWFRIIPWDTHSGDTVIEQNIHVDNNAPPTVSITEPTGVQVDTVWIHYTLADSSNDVLSLAGEYSTDSGSTWDPATITGQVSNITSATYVDSMAWLSHLDKPSITSINVQFRLSPVDEDAGTPDATNDFTLINNAPPEVDSITLDSYFAGTAIVRYSLSDIEGDDLSYTVDYSTDQTTWNTATAITGQTSGISSTQYDSVFTWAASTDISLVETDLWLRLTPDDAENATGVADTLWFWLDNAPPDSIFAQGIGNDTTIDFWFNETVIESTAVNLANISLSGSLTIDSLWANPDVATGTPLPTARENGLLAAYDGMLYFIGGYNDNYRLDRYDPESDSWTNLTSSSYYRRSGIGGFIDGKFYVTGGSNGTLSWYDPATNTWTDGAYGPSDYWATGGTMEGKLYFAGGNNYPSQLQVYDPGADSWTVLTSMTYAREYASSAIIDGKLYIAGGLDGGTPLDAVEVYDPGTSTWTTLASMPDTRYGAAGAAYQGKFHVIGGYTPTGYTDKALIYDPATDTWTENADQWLPTPRNNSASAVIGEYIYVAGGYSSSGRLDELVIIEPLAWFTALLGGGATLPGPETATTITAINITDLYGNTATSVGEDVTVITGDVPTIDVSPVNGTQGGSVKMGYTISDSEGNAISLLPEYSVNTGTSWQAATVTGDTSGIVPAGYSGTLTWDALTDQSGVELDGLLFKITPRDNPTTAGTADSISFRLDTASPDSLFADGVGNAATFRFWFNESVKGTFINDLGNVGLSNSLTVDSLWSILSNTTGSGMPGANYASATVTLGGRVYVIGGHNDSYAVNAYDPITDTWETKSSVTHSRGGRPSAGVIDGKIYVAGSGYYSLEIYDPAADSWSFGTDAPSYTYDAAVGVINGKLYLAGGTEGGYTSSLNIYDPATDSWSTGTDMPAAREPLPGAVIDGKLYAVGGEDASGHSDALEIYDPATDFWSTGANLPSTLNWATTAVFDGKLYVIGGYDGSFTYSYLRTAYVYDPASDSWTLDDQPWLQRDLQHPNGAVLGDRIYIAGGWDINIGAIDELLILDPNSEFGGRLSSGQNLPGPGTPVTVTASNVSDLQGNTATTIDGTLTTTTGQVPKIAITPQTDTKSGDITIPYQLSDAEQNAISLFSEYSADQGTTWAAATISSSDTAGIDAAAYKGSVVWDSRTDLNDTRTRVWFRIMPRDNDTVIGVTDTTTFYMDNVAPGGLHAWGGVGAGDFHFRYNKAVSIATATNTANLSISDGLTIDVVSRFGDSWMVQDMLTTNTVSAATHYRGRLYVAGGYDAPYSLYRYTPGSDSWEELASFSAWRAGAVLRPIEDTLYLIGANELETYDVATDTWTQVWGGPSAPWMSGEVIDGILYVAGGDNSGVITDLWSYDPAMATWTNLTPMPTARANMASGVLGGKLYLAGGWDGSGLSDVLEVYDPATDTWESKVSMITAGAYGSAGVINNILYVTALNTNSGFDTHVYAYDPVADAWSTEDQQLLNQRYQAAGAVVSNKLYLTGGQTPQGNSSLVEVFDPFGHYTATLSGGGTLPFQQLTLQTDAVEDLFGNPSGTLTYDFVPDDGNGNPTIALDAITGDVGGDISIGYTITDPEGDPSYLWPRWSTDGGTTWYAAAAGSDTTGVSSGTGAFIWQSFTDLPNCEIDSMMVRLSVSNNLVEIPQSDEITFHLDNNVPPTATITSTVTSIADTTWTIHFTLNDDESDTLSWIARYSSDDGANWYDATFTAYGGTSDITSSAYTDSLLWDVQKDMPDATQDALFRIIPSDLDEGTPGDASIQLNSLGVPSITITSDQSGELNGNITIAFDAADPNDDAISLTFEFEYPEGSGSWSTATTTGSSSLAGPGEYSSSVTWYSSSDLDGMDYSNCRFRIRPHDGSNEGFGDTATIHLDNNDVPVVTASGAADATNSREFDVLFNVTDTESDDLNIWGQYSTDTGTSWNPMSIMEGDGSIYPATGGSYPTSLTWKSFEDLGYTNLGGVMFRIYAADNDTSGAADSSTFDVINYVGDYSGDTLVDFADFATLVTAWNGQDTYHDIGPATGIVPNLQPEYDGQIDFEDLAIYAMMWTWSDANPPAAAQVDHTLGRPLQAPGDEPGQADVARHHPIVLNQPEPEDMWAPDTGILEVSLDARNVVALTSAGMVLSYDTEHLKFLEVVPGPFLGRTTGNRQSQIFMKRVKGELGLIELMFGRIESENPEVSGNGRVATLRFEKLSRENSAVRVSYDLKNRRAETVTSGTYETSVAAIRVPKDFSLLQNYPNPFNGETMIRFQLPDAQRVQLYVYNIRGQRVATIIDERMDAGYHRITWNGRNDDGRRVGSGVYIYLIQAGPHRQSKKLTYIK